MNKEVEITISEMQLNGTTAIRIMKCLKEHEPEIWHELKETIKQKLPIPDVVGQSEQLFCHHEGSYTLKKDGTCCKCHRLPKPKAK
tara:strand:+ start:259 stop:516 length:258 start_codon:yes stop_codon:yes gene_type:complete